MMKVTPMMTGIICNSRRMMYLPTPTSLSSRSDKAPWWKHSVGPPKLLRRADTLSGSSRSCRSLDLDSHGVEHAEGVDLDVGHLVGPGRGGQVVPERGGREVPREQPLSLLIQAVGLVKTLRCRRLGQQLL